MGPRDPRFSSPPKRERTAARGRGIWGQYVAVCSVSNSPLAHNPFATLSQPFRIKWEVYFSKELCSFVIIIDFVFACICITAMQYINSTPFLLHGSLVLCRKLIYHYETMDSITDVQTTTIKLLNTSISE